MGRIFLFASVIDWGWLRIGPPYIYINIDPVIVHVGPFALHWYGLMYVVAILVGLFVAQRYATRKGITQAIICRTLWWCIAAGLIGGRLYFVVQQPNFVSSYLVHPQHILATWEGGMAFFGAIFLIIPVLLWRARAERINPLVLIDAGVLFAAAGQIFGRIGNLINGDIIGYRSTLPWSTVYQHPASWACQIAATCHVPVQPAAGYELLPRFRPKRAGVTFLCEPGLVKRNLTRQTEERSNLIKSEQGGSLCNTILHFTRNEAGMTVGMPVCVC